MRALVRASVRLPVKSRRGRGSGTDQAVQTVISVHDVDAFARVPREILGSGQVLRRGVSVR